MKNLFINLKKVIDTTTISSVSQVMPELIKKINELSIIENDDESLDKFISSIFYKDVHLNLWSDLVRTLLNKGLNVNKNLSGSNKNMLDKAIIDPVGKNKVFWVNFLLNFDIDKENNHAIYSAIQIQNPEILNILLDYGLRCIDKKNILIDIVKLPKKDSSESKRLMLSHLIKNIPNLDIQQKRICNLSMNKYNMIGYAFLDKDYELIHYLINIGVNLLDNTVLEKNGEEVLLFELEEHKDDEMLKIVQHYEIKKTVNNKDLKLSKTISKSKL